MRTATRAESNAAYDDELDEVGSSDLVCGG